MSVPARDVGSLIESVQNDIEAVRRRLECLNRSDPEEYGDLRRILADTQSRMQQRASQMLSAAESSPSALARGDPHVARKVDRRRSRTRLMNVGQTISRGPIMDQQLQRKTQQILADPQSRELRSLLAERFGVVDKNQNTGSRKYRPINRYGHQGSLRRPEPAHRAARASLEAGEGLYGLIEKGVLPKDIDATEVLGIGCAPTVHTGLASKPAVSLQRAKFHSHESQYDRPTVLTVYEAEANQHDDLQTRHCKQDNQLVLVSDRAPTHPHIGTSPEVRTTTPEPKTQESTMRVATKQLQFNFERALAGHEQVVVSTSKEPMEALAEPRHYNALLDEFSLHQFMIRKGETIRSTPEFQSFQRRYAEEWERIESIIGKLEELLRISHVDMAYANGQRVAVLAAQGHPNVLGLVSCFSGVDHGTLLSRIPGYRFLGRDGQSRAVVIVQASVRMFLAKRAAKLLRRKHYAALRIQQTWRSFAAKISTRKRIADRWYRRLRRWRSTMDTFIENWSDIKQKHRVIIHIPSLSLPESQRASLHNFPMLENTALPRLCDLQDPNVEIIYITPYDLAREVRSYYLKMLQMGGLENPQDRLKILTPKIYDKYPLHTSLATLVLLDSALLSKIKSLVRGRPAYIVPGQVGPEDLRLAVELQLPLFAPEPRVSYLFSSKTGSKRLLEDAKIPTPIGAFDIFHEQDFFTSLTELILMNPEIRRYIFKINDESGGRGIAYFNVHEMKEYKSYTQECKSLMVDTSNDQSRTTQALKSEYRARIMDSLKHLLPDKAVLALPRVWDQSWHQYLNAFLSVGGVIEACPSTVVASPCVNIYVEPDGTVTMPSTFDQLFVSPYVQVGCMFPSATHYSTLHQAAMVVGAQCHANNIYGHVSVDFVVYMDTGADSGLVHEPQYRLWAVDLNIGLHPNSAWSSFELFHFLMRGRWHNGQYLVPSKPKRRNNRKPRTDSTGPLKEQPRFFVSVGYMYHPTLAALQFATFFNLCRLQNISFDIRGRCGTAFMLLDGLASGSLGTLCVGHSRVDALERMTGCLNFLLLKDRTDIHNRNDSLFASEHSLHDVYLAFRSMWNVYKEQAAMAVRR